MNGYSVVKEQPIHRYVKRKTGKGLSVVLHLFRCESAGEENFPPVRLFLNFNKLNDIIDQPYVGIIG